jgi:hypothetical protein
MSALFSVVAWVAVASFIAKVSAPFRLVGLPE